MGFSSFNTARRTLKGIEAINMKRIGQVQGANFGNIRALIELVSQPIRNRIEKDRLSSNHFCDTTGDDSFASFNPYREPIRLYVN